MDKLDEIFLDFTWIKMPQQSVKAYLKEWGSMSTMHGIPWLVSARTGRARIFWTVICILAMAMFIYMLVSLVVKYYQYPVVVKVDQVMHIMNSNILKKKTFFSKQYFSLTSVRNRQL